MAPSPHSLSDGYLGTARVAVVDDHSIVCSMFRMLVERSDSLEFAWSALDLKEARQRVKADLPCLLILDVSLPDGDGYDFAQEILKTHPELPILMMSMYSETEYSERAFEVGARGYAVKNTLPSEFIEVIKMIRAGEYYFNPPIDLPCRVVA